MKEIHIAKQIDAKRLVMAVVMTSFMVSNAFGAELKTSSKVSADVVTVSDVFDGVTDNAGYVLAPAPTPGKSFTLGVNDLKRISDAFHLGWEPKSQMDHLTISRASHNIDGYAIEAALQEKMVERLNGEKFELNLSDRSVEMHLTDAEPATVEVEDMTFDAAKGNFRATMVAPSKANPLVRKEVTGKVYTMVDVPVLKTALKSGDIVGASDIVYVETRRADIASNAVLDAGKLVGMSPRRALGSGKMIAATDLEMPTLVKKGQIVTMVLKNAMIQLTTQGKALSDAAEGEVVRVINTSSNQIIEGTVTGPQTVEIQSPSNAISG